MSGPAIGTENTIVVNGMTVHYKVGVYMTIVTLFGNPFTLNKPRADAVVGYMIDEGFLPKRRIKVRWADLR